MSRADDLQTRVELFADRVLTFCDSILPSPKTNRLIDQLAGAVSSTAANYRAARRARSHSEFTAKIGLVVEEADEAEYWLGIAIRRSLGDVASAPAIRAEAAELVRIFSRTAATARKNERQGNLRRNHPITQ